MEPAEQEPIFPREPFDKEWYEKFESIGSFQAYEYLDGNADVRKEQKNKFISHELENPTLDYPKLNSETLKQQDADLLALKHEIVRGSPRTPVDPEKLEVIRQVYRWKINEKLAETRMLQAALKPELKGNMNRFKRYSEFIYGKPSPEVFAYTVNSLREKLQSENTENPALQAAMTSLSELLPQVEKLQQSFDNPSSTVLSTAHEQTISELGHIIKLPETSEPEIDATAIKQTFELALKELRIDNWKVIINPDKKSIGVNQEKHEVNIPPERRATLEKLAGLTIHEIGTHVLRRNNGERSYLKLLALGLDRYEGGEEGVTTMREQALSGVFEDFAGLDGHLSISLAEGLDGKPRNFREVFEIMFSYYLVEELSRNVEPEKAKENAQNKAWDRCVRTFRGTDCKTAGSCFTKDIIYREGNIGVWDLIKTRPQEIKQFNIGKYDPTNKRHLWVLTKLGITDADLADLENDR